MSRLKRQKPVVNTTSGSYYYELWRRQNKKDALDGSAISPSDTVYYDDAGFLTLTYSASRTEVDLSYSLGDNKAQQVGDPNVW